jgi:hypothetical protein
MTETLNLDEIRDAVVKAIADGEWVPKADGHTLFKPTAYDALPSEFVEKYIETHVSDGTPKGTIFVDGMPVKELKAVYNLELLWGVANLIGADTAEAGDKIGRGFQAQTLVPAIHAKVKELTDA